MGTRAIIAAILDDGSIIASNVAYEGDEVLAETLARHYGSQPLARGLVVLGDLLEIDNDGAVTPSTVLGKHRVYADLEALDTGKLANANHVHLFRDDAWEHLPDDEAQRFQDALEREIAEEKARLAEPVC